MSEVIDKIIEKTETFENDSWVLIYADTEIILEKLNNLRNKKPDKINKLTFNDIKELRVFNEQDELKIWKYNEEIKDRLFSESKNNDYKIYKETMLLWGNDVEKKSLLKESGRGAAIYFPVKITKSKLPLKIEVENYYTYDDNGLIQFYDARLLKIVDKDNKEVK